MADIDASETVGWNDDDGFGGGFVSIAFNVSGGFSGSFVNASNYVISSLTISRSGENNVGLFSRLANGGTLTGIRLVGSRITGSSNVGSLVGGSVEGVIEGCSATGSVSGNNYVGGLVGLNEGNISDSYATGSVSGNNYVGGLVGLNEGNISDSYVTDSVVGGLDFVGGLAGSVFNISDSYATGSVVEGRSDVGGLVGSGTNISDSYATGSVSGRGSNVGGLAGSGTNISNSYATGSVSGRGFNVGGLVGLIVRGSISNSYATGSVSGGAAKVGGLVGIQIGGDISNSYYVARGQRNGFGTERTFAQLRCPMMSSATCSLSSTNQRTYEDWDESVWGFGSATDLPQLSSNRNSELNLKPYIKGSAELVVRTNFPGITRFSLEADYPGTPVGSVVLTWSLLFDEPSTLSDFVYFELENGTTSTEASGSALTLAVVRDDLMDENSFYVVLKNNISVSDDQVSDDQVRVRTEKAKQPYILRDDGIRPAPIGSTNTFSFSVGYAGTPGKPVTLTWSLEDLPTTLRHLVYFELAGGSTSTTFTDSAKLTSSARMVTLVVVGNKELAGRSFYVVLKNDISVSDDRVRVQVEGDPPEIFRDDDRLVLIGSTNTFSFSVGYTGSSVPVTLTWSLEDVPISLRHLVYFDLGNDTTDTTVTDSGRLTGNASTVTLVVVGNEELSGKDFYVVLKNNVSANDDRVLIQVQDPTAIRLRAKVYLGGAVR